MLDISVNRLSFTVVKNYKKNWRPATFNQHVCSYKMYRRSIFFLHFTCNHGLDPIYNVNNEHCYLCAVIIGLSCLRRSYTRIYILVTVLTWSWKKVCYLGYVKHLYDD